MDWPYFFSGLTVLLLGFAVVAIVLAIAWFVVKDL